MGMDLRLARIGRAFSLAFLFPESRPYVRASKIMDTRL